MNKKFAYKIYERDDPTSTGFVDFIDPAKITSTPTFSSEINGSQGELRISYSCKFDDFPASFALTNLVKVYEISEYFPTGRLLYCGQISKITPYKRAGAEGIEITVLGLASMLSLAIFKQGASYSPSFTTTDVADIFKAIIADFNSIHGNILDASAIAATGAVVDFKSERLNHFNALENAFKFAPDGYFWRIDPEGTVKLQAKSATADLRFKVDSEIIELEATQSVEDLQNGYLLVCGGALGEKFYNNPTSEAAYGKRQKVESDSAIEDATSADTKGAAFIENNKNPKDAPKILLGNNYDFGGIRVGQTCKILNFKKDSGVFGDNMRIERIDYSPNKARLYLEEQKGIFGLALKKAING